MKRLSVKKCCHISIEYGYNREIIETSRGRGYFLLTRPFWSSPYPSSIMSVECGVDFLKKMLDET